MNVKDLTYWLKDFWTEFKRVPSGLIGIGILLCALFIVIFEPFVLSFPDANGKWRNPTYWEDSPKSAPPQWINLFRKNKLSTSDVIIQAERKESYIDSVRSIEQTFYYDYQFDEPSLDITIRTRGTGSVVILVKLIRPDNLTVELSQAQLEFSGNAEKRISIDAESRMAVLDFLNQFENPELIRNTDVASIMPIKILFSKTPDMLKAPKPLKGKYQFIIVAYLIQEGSEIKDTSVVISGSASGIMGTDSYKRDIFSGIIAGMKWALLIGILTAVISVGIGVVYGVVSAYFGGIVDDIMNRVFEIFVSVPLLPVLIVMSAVFKPSIWVMIIMMCMFFWTGPVKTVRSMALQIKEETFIEATRAVGGSHVRLIFKHMVPILIPYSFASMALYVPGAIVYEATISLIGLGDATIVTWGQILHDALSGGAVLSGLWWWVIPPGLTISIMGMTFAFIGFAMDKILHPKLRTR